MLGSNEKMTINPWTNPDHFFLDEHVADIPVAIGEWDDNDIFFW